MMQILFLLKTNYSILKTRDVAARFNNQMGETLVIPEPKLQEESKMLLVQMERKWASPKEYHFFSDEKAKETNYENTNSKPSIEDKNPNDCNVYNIYSLIASKEKEVLKTRYTTGGLGYGEAKEILFNEILKDFKKNEIYITLTIVTREVESVLQDGAKKQENRYKLFLKELEVRLDFNCFFKFDWCLFQAYKWAFI